MPWGPFPSGGAYCAGNIVLDVLIRPVESLPPWGATALVDSIAQHMGGNGANTAYALGKLDTPVKLAGCVGQDPFGEYVLARLRGVKVDVSQVRVLPGVQTATTAGLVNARGERLFYHVLGASNTVEPEQISFAPSVIGGLSYFHFGSIFNLPRMRSGAAGVLERARQAGLVTSLDTMWDTAGRWMEDIAPLCPLLDCLFLNQDEARMLAGSAEPAQVARCFTSRGVRMVVLKMAGQGCAICGAGEPMRVPAFSVPVVDTTGAGDCFCGGFLAALSRGWAAPEAARFACAVAAHSIQHIGGAEGLAGFQQTLAWMERKH